MPGSIAGIKRNADAVRKRKCCILSRLIQSDSQKKSQRILDWIPVWKTSFRQAGAPSSGVLLQVRLDFLQHQKQSKKNSSFYHLNHLEILLSRLLSKTKSNINKSISYLWLKRKLSQIPHRLSVIPDFEDGWSWKAGKLWGIWVQREAHSSRSRSLAASEERGLHK